MVIFDGLTSIRGQQGMFGIFDYDILANAEDTPVAILFSSPQGTCLVCDDKYLTPDDVNVNGFSMYALTTTKWRLLIAGDNASEHTLLFFQPGLSMALQRNINGAKLRMHPVPLCSSTVVNFDKIATRVFRANKMPSPVISGRMLDKFNIFCESTFNELRIATWFADNNIFDYLGYVIAHSVRDAEQVLVDDWVFDIKSFKSTGVIKVTKTLKNLSDLQVALEFSFDQTNLEMTSTSTHTDWSHIEAFQQYVSVKITRTHTFQFHTVTVEDEEPDTKFDFTTSK